MKKHSCILNIGFDDTDSPKGMCTTYLAFRLVDSLRKDRDVSFVDYPRLVRFNPNIPWKTRGNGAVGLCIRVYGKDKGSLEAKLDSLKKLVRRMVKKYSDTENGANPGLVFYQNERIPAEFQELSKSSLWQLVSRSSVKRFVKKHNIESYYHGNGQGLVGALGVIGYSFADHTLELLRYRTKKMFGKKRNIPTDIVKRMQEKTWPHTFNSYDSKKHRIMIAPHGPDPVLYGIRGEDAGTLVSASKMVNPKESDAGYMIFKTNQGTGAHLENQLDVNSMKPYMSGYVVGMVSTIPQIRTGRHVFFSVTSGGKEIPCAVYRETGLATVALELVIGDVIRVGGGIRKASKKNPHTLNVEYIFTERLKEIKKQTNPLCVSCNKRMKSKGKNQGFECVKCKKKAPAKTDFVQTRRLVEKQLYMPATSAHRHLTRPPQRIGVSNRNGTFNPRMHWFVSKL